MEMSFKVNTNILRTIQQLVKNMMGDLLVIPIQRTMIRVA